MMQAEGTATSLANSCSHDGRGVIQLGPLGSDAMFEVIEISDACFVHLLLQYASSQLDLNLANLEAIVTAK